MGVRQREPYLLYKHFNTDAFETMVNLPGQEKMYRHKLKRDELGIASFPSMYCKDDTEKHVVSDRAARAIKRKVRNGKNFMFQHHTICIILYIILCTFLQ